FAKLNALRDNELAAQARWEKERVFEADAPSDGSKGPKFMATFPYPYMNGRLHLGHAFTISKSEFAVGYQRLKGKVSLFPFGFHCSGMPIKASADKIKAEVEMFGQNFERFVEETEPEPVEAPKPVEGKTDPTKIEKKHGKAAAKNTGLKYQFLIMKQLGIPTEEIHKFADSSYWLGYFPPRAISDLKSFGLSTDWRRSFITTDHNPYYDSFVQWQFRLLRQPPSPKVKFGERYTIYSALDGQACMDHDRASGEGVGVQEYTGIKLEVLLNELAATPLDQRDTVKDKPVGEALTAPHILSALKGKKVYMVAATLRPETMYGQTNCYVGVDIEYGIFEAPGDEAWICTPRAAKNMAFQNLFAQKGAVIKIGTLKGWDLVGVPIKAPLSPYPKVYTLPMDGVLVTKGTGVVTSVPSDSPDDFITLQDLVKKPAFYNVQPKWVEPFLPPTPIIQTPNYGNLAAVTAVQELNIKSQRDKKELAEAKERVYKEGFYNGIMLVGPCKGKTVQEAKPMIKNMLIEGGHAFNYCEPEGLVVSRSGDECIVSLTDQWYMDYGEESWKKLAQEALARMETYFPETRNAFEKTLDWLGQWACSRSFGLGTRMPWDPQYLIESLSDSTIYMAYYTVAHMLHSTLDGSKMGSLNISASDMKDDVWDYILLGKDMPKETNIPKSSLEAMRREFEFFYPMDLRSSGKDLINNHLTFSLYNHTAIFPKDLWPQSMRCNGHLLLNGEKMSKSTGNFMSLYDSIERYGADATRFALADAGDGLDDANFLCKTADDAVLKLHTEKELFEEMLADANAGKLRTGEYSWSDRVFLSEMARIVSQADRAYTATFYREALKVSFYDLQNVKSEYRKITVAPPYATEEYEGMHRDLVLLYIELQAVLMSPLTPHWSEYIWSTLLKKPESITKAKWPKLDVVPDESILAAAQYIRDLIHKTRSAEETAIRKKAKGKKTAVAEDTTTPKTIRFYYAKEFPSWQVSALAALKTTWDSEKGAFTGKEREAMAAAGLASDKRVMPFVAMIKKNIDTNGPSAFDRTVSFDEKEALYANETFIGRELASFKLDKGELKVTKVEFVAKVGLTVGGEFTEEDIAKAEPAVPGAPTYRML
ncbi:cytosolic leucyl tRNA synthetase, partial [Cladochytrium tenue]